MSLGELILSLEDALGLPFSYIVVLIVFIIFVGYTVFYSFRDDSGDKGVSQVVLSQMQKDNKALREDMAKTLKEVVGTIPQVIQSSMLPYQGHPQPQLFQPQPQPQFGQPRPQGQLPFGFPQPQLQFIPPQFTPTPQPQPQPQQYPPSQTYGPDIPAVLQDGSYAVGMANNPDGTRIVRYIKPANNPQGYELVDWTFPAPAPKSQEGKPPQPEDKTNQQGTSPKSNMEKLMKKVENASKKSKVGEIKVDESKVGEEPQQDGTQ